VIESSVGNRGCSWEMRAGRRGNGKFKVAKGKCLGACYAIYGWRIMVERFWYDSAGRVWSWMNIVGYKLGVYIEDHLMIGGGGRGG
jgi:hypothetical protein